jgi:hypothetical protein
MMNNAYVHGYDPRENMRLQDQASTLVEGFTKKTFTAMIEGVCESAIGTGMIGEQIIDRGIRDLYRTAEPDGVFCYTFFKAVGEK